MILLPDTARGHNQHCLCPCQPGAVETTPPGSQFQVGCTCLTGQNPSYPFLTVIPALWAHIAKVARVIFQRLDPDPGPKLGLSVSNLRKKWKFVTFCFRISLFWYILLLFSFKFENQTPVQTPSTIDATEFQKCFYLCNGLKNQANSCYCWKSKVTLGPKERRILPKLTLDPWLLLAHISKFLLFAVLPIQKQIDV